VPDRRPSDPPRLTVTIDRESIPVIVILAGEIDVETAEGLRDTLDDLSRGTHDVVLDMHQVEFMDSSGLGLLLAARKRGRFTLRGLSDRALRLFQMTGLYEVFDIQSDPEDG
jgi:anti-anti-sigma factor